MSLERFVGSGPSESDNGIVTVSARKSMCASEHTTAQSLREYTDEPMIRPARAAWCA